MLRRLLLIVLVLAAPACANRSDRVTEIPVLPTALVPGGPRDVGTGRCSFAMGAGQGARIANVVTGSAADGVLEVGDVVTAVDGRQIRTSGDLVAEIRSRVPGDTVVLDHDRAGGTVSATVVLGENPDQAGQARLGVEVDTSETRIEPADLSPSDMTNPLTRVATVGDALWLLDPTGVTWSALDVTVPEGAVVSLDGSLYTIEVRTEFVATVIDLTTGESVDVDLIEWDPVTLIGTLDDLILLGAQRPDAAGTVADRGIVAIDPVAGTPRWSWITDPASPSPEPIIGHRSLDGDSILVGLGAVGSSTADLWVLLSEQGRGPVSTVADALSGEIVVLGWHDADRVLAISGAIDRAVLVDPVTATRVETTLPLSGTPLAMWPVGDGAHLLVQEEGGLVLAEVGGIERRKLTSSCARTTAITDLGWIAG